MSTIQSGEAGTGNKVKKSGKLLFNGNENLIIIGNVHSHPFTENEMNDPEHGFVLPPFDSNSGDAKFSSRHKIPVYQLQYNGLYRQLSNKKISGKASEDQEELFEGNIDIARDALEISGGKPTSTVEIKNEDE